MRKAEKAEGRPLRRTPGRSVRSGGVGRAARYLSLTGDLLAVSLFVGWLVARKNRKIDMVSALKAEE